MKPLLNKGVPAKLRRRGEKASSATARAGKSDEAVSTDRLKDLRQAWLSGRIQQGPGQPGEPDGDQEPLRRRMMDLVVGRDRRSTPKLDNRGGRGHYLRQVRDVGRGAQSRHIGAEKVPCTVLLRNRRS